MPYAVKIIIIVIASYLLGNINFAVILSHFKHGDIRKSGSGNPGTMNVIRTYGKLVGVMCLVLDVLKAAIPAFFSWWLMAGELCQKDDMLGIYISGLAMTVGHIYPVFLKFKGGKGIACIIGVSLVAVPVLTLIALAAGILFIIIFKVGALGSFIIIFVPNLYVAYSVGPTDPAVAALIFALVALALFAHRSNVYRLFTGTENRTVLFPKKKTKEKR